MSGNPLLPASLAAVSKLLRFTAILATDLSYFFLSEFCHINQVQILHSAQEVIFITIFVSFNIVSSSQLNFLS